MSLPSRAGGDARPASRHGVLRWVHRPISFLKRHPDGADPGIVSEPAASLESIPRILLAVLDRKRLASLRAAVTHCGFEALDASDGGDALAQVERLRPDLLLLDAAIPGLPAASVCRRIRENEIVSSTPVVVVAGRAEGKTVDRLLDAGADDFLLAPFDESEVARRLRCIARWSRTAEGLRHNERSLSRAQSIARVGSFEWRIDDGELVWSRATFRLLGVDPSEKPTQERFVELVHPLDREMLRGKIAQAVARDERFRVEHRVQAPDGTLAFVQLRGEPSAPGRRRGRWYSGTLQDVTEQVRSQVRIRQLAMHDALTGLPNRRFFEEQLERAIRTAQQSDQQGAVLYVDLDRFKAVNDLFGHPVGDDVLRHVAERIRTNVRGGDTVARSRATPAGMVSRIGGDEFTVLLSRTARPEDAGEVAARILDSLEQPFVCGGRRLQIGASIGIAVFPIDGEHPNELIEKADLALFKAKETPERRIQFFSAELDARVARRRAIELGFERAARNGELRLVYQPRLDLVAGEITSAEALMRWSHPELGELSPREFIPIAEKSGWIGALGDWALATACAQMRAWVDAGLSIERVSVNLTTGDLSSNDLTERIARALRSNDLAPRHLEIEITESALVTDPETTALALRDLRSIGVGIALDDFGSGYSCLGYLGRLSLDVIKLDRSFLHGLEDDPAVASVVRAVLALGRDLGIRMVAEGVETPAHERFLRQHGCHEIQGFLLSPPLPPDDAARFFSKRA